MDVLDNIPGPASDIVCLNAGAVLYVADIAKDIGSGIRMAREAIESGSARNKLNDFITATQASL